MKEITVLHNPRCGKSRQTLKLVQEKQGEGTVRVVKYLEEPPTPSELREIIGKLGISPIDLVRKQEKIWKEQFKGKDLSEDELIKIMSENPILIERPIVMKGKKAALGRPPENVLDIL